MAVSSVALDFSMPAPQVAAEAAELVWPADPAAAREDGGAATGGAGSRHFSSPGQRSASLERSQKDSRNAAL